MLIQAETAVAESAQRRCIVTGEVKDTAGMLRFVAAPDGKIVPDLAGNLPGRGIWLTTSRGTLDTAAAKGLFAKAARAPVVAEADLADRVEGLLTRRCLETIGLAQRAGQVVAGFEKVRACLQRDEAAVLLAANDGGADGRAQLRGRAGSVPVVALFTGAQLSAALGRENVVHAALRPGGLAGKLLVQAARLAEFRAPGEAG